MTVEVRHHGAPEKATIHVPLTRHEDGYHRGADREGQVGDRYRFVVDRAGPFPDPASRWQPEGVHGPSMVIDPTYMWTDQSWSRPPFRDLVIYELHVGAFTPQGTFRAVIERLPHLRSLGVTAVEIMPIADFPGQRSWGYDGVCLYAPARCYGHPDDLRELVNTAHRLGLAVLLDVVYNHLGPDGNYLSQFSEFYFNPIHQTPWGSALNFDGPHCEAVRSFFLSNVAYWMDEFHIDGLRLDATHTICDDSTKYLLEEIAEVVHLRGGYVIAEDERNLAKLIAAQPEGGHGLDAVYADDFCHTVQLALGDERYGEDFTGAAQELTTELKEGWLYQGQVSQRHGRPRGTPPGGLPPERFMFCISNHDQIGNRAFGERLHQLTTPEAFRAASALLLLSPYTPQIFMGQEWAATSPFLYFTDHHEELGKLVSQGRRLEFARFADFADADLVAQIPDPQDLATFECSKLDWSEPTQEPHSGVLALYRECLRLRMFDAAFRPASREGWEVTHRGIIDLHLRSNRHHWRLLVCLRGGCAALPIVEGWQLVLSSNETRFGGTGPGLDAANGMVSFALPELILLRSAS